MMPLIVLPLLLVVLFVLYGAPPLSVDAFTQPYSSLPSIVLGAFGAGYAVLFVLYLFPVFSKQPGGEMTVFAMSEMPGLMGFVIGVLNRDAWAALPFFAVSLALYAYVTMRLRSDVERI